MTEKIMDASLSMTDGESEVTVQGYPAVKDTNKVLIEGRLIHVFTSPRTTLLTVMTMTGWDRNMPSAISITVPPELKEQALALNIKDVIKVEGVYRTVIRTNKETGEKQYVYNVTARSLEKAKSDLEALTGIEGGRSYGASYNKVILVGDIARTSQVRKGTTQITLKTSVPGSDRAFYADARLYAKNMKKLAPQLIVGNHICLIGEIQTKVIEKEGCKKEYIHNLVVSDIREV